MLNAGVVWQVALAGIVLQHSQIWRSTGVARVAAQAALAHEGTFLKIRRRGGVGNATNV